MDTSGFFDYPTLGGGRKPAPEPGFLPGATGQEWDAVLVATETLRFHPGDLPLRADLRDRAFYLLLDGRLEVEGAAPRCATRRRCSASPRSSMPSRAP